MMRRSAGRRVVAAMSEPPVTLVESRVVRAGREAAFDRWIERYVALLAAEPGHCDTLRLDQIGGFVHCIARFEDAASLAAFRERPDTRALLAEAEPLSVALVQQAAGRDVHLRIPSEAAARKWKRFLVTLAGVFPVLVALSTAVRTLLPGWPPLAQLAVSSPLLTAALQWLILPRLQRWSRFWTLQDGHGVLPKSPG